MHLVRQDEYEEYLQELQKLDPKIHIELALAAAAATTAAHAAMNHTNVALARLQYAQKRHELIEKGVQFDPSLREYDIDKDGPVLSDSILPLGTRVVRFFTHSKIIEYPSYENNARYFVGEYISERLPRSYQGRHNTVLVVLTYTHVECTWESSNLILQILRMKSLTRITAHSSITKVVCITLLKSLLNCTFEGYENLTRASRSNTGTNLKIRHYMKWVYQSVRFSK